MANEQEELRLTVSLADNASAGLEKLNEQIKQLGQGAGPQHLEKFKRETGDLQSRLKAFGQEADGAFRGLGLLRAGLGAGAVAVGTLSAAVIKQIKELGDYTDKLRAVAIAARTIGVNPGQLKNLTDQFQEVGVSADTATSGIASVSQKIAELKREGSTLKLDLLREAGNVDNMRAYINRLENAKTVAQQLNIIREAGEQVYNNARRRGYGEQEAANLRNNFWAKQGYTAQLAELHNAKELSAEQQRWADERFKNAQAYSKELGEIGNKWDDVLAKLKDPLIGPDSPFLAMLKASNATLDWIIEKLDQVKREDERAARIDKELPAPGGLQNLNPFNQRNIDREQRMRHPDFQDRWRERIPEELQKNTEATKKLTSLIEEGTAGGRGATGGGFMPAAFHPDGGGGFGGGFGGGGGLGGRGASPRSFGSAEYPNLGGGGYSGGAPYGNDAGPGTGRGAGATPAGPPTGGPPGKGPITLGKGDDPRGMEGYIRERAEKYGVDPDTAVRVAKSEGLRDFYGDHGKSGGAFQLYTGRRAR